MTREIFSGRLWALAKMSTTRWTADEIRSEYKRGRYPIVVRQGKEFHNMGPGTAAQLAGTYLVNQTDHEILVFLDTQGNEGNGGVK